MKVRAYFNRRTPFYLLSPAEATDSLGFDAYPVEVDEVTLANVRSVRRLVELMEAHIEQSGAPEDSAQADADLLETHVRRIFKTRAQDNTAGDEDEGHQDQNTPPSSSGEPTEDTPVRKAILSEDV